MVFKCSTQHNFMDFKIEKSFGGYKIFKIVDGYWKPINGAIFKDTEVSFINQERQITLNDIKHRDKPPKSKTQRTINLEEFIIKYFRSPRDLLLDKEKDEIVLLDKVVEKFMIRFNDNKLHRVNEVLYKVGPDYIAYQKSKKHYKLDVSKSPYFSKIEPKNNWIKSEISRKTSIARTCDIVD